MRFSVTSRWRRPSRMHFSVRVRSQNALFRRVRFSSPAQTWSHLTQRRILRRRSHVKAQSAPATSRKGALCATARMQNAPFGEARTQNALFRGVARPECAFPWRRPPGMRFSVASPARNALFRESDTPQNAPFGHVAIASSAQSGAFVYTVATRFAEASTHTNPRRALKGQHWSIRER
mgnify:CR=1 FL=1